MNFNIEQDEIYTFKLATGEEIVCRVKEIGDVALTAVHPVSCVVSQQGLQMMPSMFSSDLDKTVQIAIANIVLVGDTREDVKSSYLQATTGIQTPPAKQIITG